MPRSDYLKTASNVPALPSGWHWHLSYHQTDKHSTVTDRIVNWTKLLVEIVDDDNKVLSNYLATIRTEHIEARPEVVDRELQQACYAAYNRLYADTKVNFYAAINFGPLS